MCPLEVIRYCAHFEDFLAMAAQAPAVESFPLDRGDAKFTAPIVSGYIRDEADLLQDRQWPVGEG